jgi:hypothetical protein
VERVTRIELALSAWESDRSAPLGPLTSQDRAPPVAVTDPLVTVANCTLIARSSCSGAGRSRLSRTWPCHDRLCQTGERADRSGGTTLNKVLVLIPVLVLAAGFVVFCEVDLARAEEVRYLPKWVWAIFCMGIGLTIPFGGIAYLVFGKVRRPRPR